MYSVPSQTIDEYFKHIGGSYNGTDVFGQYNIVLDDTGEQISQDLIYSESVEWSQSVNGGNVLVPGGCIASSFSFECAISDTMKDRWITVSFSCVNESGAILTDENSNSATVPIGHFKIVKSERTEKTDYYRKITAYDSLYVKANKKAKKWCQKVLQNVHTLGEQRESLLDFMGISYVSQKGLANNDKVAVLPFYDNDAKCVDMLKYICQLSGGYGIMNREGKFEVISIYVGSEYLYTNAEYGTRDIISASTEDYNILGYTGVELYTTSKKSYRFPESSDDPDSDNILSYPDNPFLRALKGSSNSELLRQYAINIFYAISGIGRYRPGTLECEGNVLMDAGDAFTVKTLDDGEVHLSDEYIFIPMRRTLRGITNLIDSYSCDGESQDESGMTYSDTSLSAQVKKLSNRTSDVEDRCDSINDDLYVYRDGSRSMDYLTVGSRGDGDVGEGSITSGSGSVATKSGGVALGDGASSTGTDSVSIGKGSSSSGDFSSAFGTHAKSAGTGSLAAGYRSKAEGGVAVGINSDASSGGSVAFGYKCYSGSQESIAVGYGCSADRLFHDGVQSRAIAIGYEAKALGNDCTAIGMYAKAGQYLSSVSASEEERTRNAVAIGTSYVKGDHSLGIAPNDYDYINESISYSCIVSGNNSIGIGCGEVEGDGSVLISPYTRAHVNPLQGHGSILIGRNSNVYGSDSSNVIVVGNGNIVGLRSIDSGNDTGEDIPGHESVVIGYGLLAQNNPDKVVLGSYNEDGKNIFEIGAGYTVYNPLENETTLYRRNAFEISSSGKMYLYGSEVRSLSQEEKDKLDSVEDGAEVNQNAFSCVSSGSDSILADQKTDTLNINGSNVDISLDPDLKSINISVSKEGVTNALGYTPLNQSLKGSTNGLAELDSNGKVPSSQLPSFVDDVVEGYLSGGKFYKESTHTTEISGETGKIYIDLSTEKTYRWSGSAFVVISETLALGETSSTAYRGDRGKTAYDHSQSTHARTDATKVEKSSTNGNIKINGTETTVYTHPSGTNPHGTTKSDVGLGNVGNFKAVSTVAKQGLTDTEKSNARANIGAGTSSFSGSYNDLTNKPTIGNGTVTIKQAGTSKGTFTMNQSGNTTIELTDNNTTYGAGTGLDLSGTTFNHSNSVTAGTAQGDASKTLSFGGTFTIPTVTYDAQGHVTGKGTTTMTMPANPNTDTKATQTNTTTSADYRLVLSYNAKDTTETQTLRKSGNFLANPSTGEFYAKGYRRIDITYQTLDINTLNLSTGSPMIMHYIEKSSAGASNITNIPVTGLAFILDVELMRWVSNTDYITKQTFISVGKQANEYVRYCTNGTWSSWTKRVFTDTNTWRGIQNNLTSDSTTDSLSAAQGKVLKNLVDGKAPSSHTHSYLPLSGGTVTGELIINTGDSSKGLKFVSPDGSSNTKVSYVDDRPFVQGAWDAYMLKENGTPLSDKYQAKGDYSAKNHTHQVLRTPESYAANLVTSGLPNDIKSFFPSSSGGITLGFSSAKWGQIYSSSSTISTSDRNRKHDISYIGEESEYDTDLRDSDVEKLIMGIKPAVYKFDDGTSGRPHHGLIAQDFEDLLKEIGIDHAGFIKSPKYIRRLDEHGEDILDNDGNPIYDAVDGEYEYGFRYEELIADLVRFCQMQKERADSLEARLDAIEKRLSNVENK